MNRLQRVIILVLFLPIYSCGLDDWELTLYEQKIEGTSKAIYKYNAWGGRDSHLFGYTILDTTEIFDIYKRDELPIHLLTDIPNKTSIQTMEIVDYIKEELATYKPIKTNQIKKRGIHINTDYYQSTGYSHKSGGYEEMEFDRFIETRDSIFFYDLNEFTHMNTGHKDSLKIKKGNVRISWDSSNNLIQRIHIENLIISHDGLKSLMSNVTYSLKPKYSTKINEFSDYGVFKLKNTMPNITLDPAGGTM